MARWTDEDVIAACAAAAQGDLVERITALGVGPKMDEASMRVGESMAADLINRIADTISAVAQQGMVALARGDEEIDFRFDAAQHHVSDAAIKACSTALLRGVLVGLELSERGPTDA